MVATLRKDIGRFMMTEHIMPRVWMHWRRWTPTLGVRRGQCTAPKRLANMRRWKCQLSILTLVRGTHALISGNSQLIRRFTKIQVPRGGVYGGLVILAHPRLMVRECTLIFEPSRDKYPKEECMGVCLSLRILDSWYVSVL